MKQSVKQRASQSKQVKLMRQCPEQTKRNKALKLIAEASLVGAVVVACVLLGGQLGLI